MKIAVTGTSYVGLVTAVCLADKGHEVACVDIDKKKIEKLSAGHSPFFERGLDELIAKNRERLTFTTDWRSAYKGREVIFVGVGTPEKKDYSANLTYVFSAVEQISESVDRDCIMVIKSTVPVGTNLQLEEIVEANKSYDINIEIVSNPEFLAQGTAVRDTLYPSRIVIGTSSKAAADTMREVYKGFDAPLLIMDRESAEMVKYASNDFLALKISYINEIANLCEIVGADIESVAAGMGLDSRIGSSFLRAGIGYGGSCFPKDTKALHWLAHINDYEIKTVKAAIEVNENQKLKLYKKAFKYYPELSGLSVAVLGLTFKPGTDDLREAPSLVNIPLLLDDGAKVRVWDRVGAEKFKQVCPGVESFDTIDETITGADLCLIFTEWQEICDYNPESFVKLMKNAVVLDGRNCLNRKRIKTVDGLIYEGIGINI